MHLQSAFVCFVVRTVKIYSLSHFPVCNAVVFTEVTLLEVQSPEFTLTSQGLYPLTSILEFLLSPSSGNHQSTLPVNLVFLFFRVHI